MEQYRIPRGLKDENLILAAVQSMGPHGTSKQAIFNYVKYNYDMPPKYSEMICIENVLKMVASGHLERVPGIEASEKMKEPAKLSSLAMEQYRIPRIMKNKNLILEAVGIIGPHGTSKQAIFNYVHYYYDMPPRCNTMTWIEKALKKMVATGHLERVPGIEADELEMTQMRANKMWESAKSALEKADIALQTLELCETKAKEMKQAAKTALEESEMALSKFKQDARRDPGADQAGRNAAKGTDEDTVEEAHSESSTEEEEEVKIMRKIFEEEEQSEDEQMEEATLFMTVVTSKEEHLEEEVLTESKPADVE